MRQPAGSGSCEEEGVTKLQCCGYVTAASRRPVVAARAAPPAASCTAVQQCNVEARQASEGPTGEAPGNTRRWPAQVPQWQRSWQESFHTGGRLRPRPRPHSSANARPPCAQGWNISGRKG